MYNLRQTKNAMIKIIALTVATVFFCQSIVWADPDRIRSPLKDYLQVRLMFDSELGDALGEYWEQFNVELRTFIALAREEETFLDGNSTFHSAYGDLPGAKGQVIELATNPVIRRRGKEVEFSIRILVGPMRGAVLGVVADSENLELKSINGSRIEEEIFTPEQSEGKKREADRKEVRKKRPGKNKKPKFSRFLKGLRDHIKMFISMSVFIFLMHFMPLSMAMTNQVSFLDYLSSGVDYLPLQISGTSIDRPASRVQGSGEVSDDDGMPDVQIAHTYYMDNINVEWADLMRLKILYLAEWDLSMGLGAVRGNPAFSPLRESPYVYVDLDSSFDKPGRINEVKWRLGYLFASMDAADDEALFFSAYTLDGWSKNLGRNVMINWGGGSEAGIIAMGGYKDWMVPGGFTLASEVVYFPESGNMWSIGGSWAGCLEGQNVQGEVELDNLDFYPAEKDVWLSYTRDSAGGPMKIGVNYMTGPLEKALGANASFSMTNSGSQVSVGFENKTPNIDVVPEENNLYLGYTKDFSSDKSFSIESSYDFENESFSTEGKFGFSWGGVNVTSRASFRDDIWDENFDSLDLDRETANIGPEIHSPEGRAISDAITHMSYDEFVKYVRGNVTTLEEAIVLTTVLGHYLGEQYGEIKGTPSEKETYDRLHQNMSLEEEEWVNVGVCRHIHQFVAKMLDHAQVKDITPYVATVNPRANHALLFLQTPEGFYIADYGRIYFTGSRDVSIAFQYYQKLRGYLGAKPALYGVDGDWLARVETPDTRMLRDTLATHSRRHLEIIRNDVFERFNRKELERRREARKRAEKLKKEKERIKPPKEKEKIKVPPETEIVVVKKEKEKKVKPLVVTQEVAKVMVPVITQEVAKVKVPVVTQEVAKVEVPPVTQEVAKVEVPVVTQEVVKVKVPVVTQEVAKVTIEKPPEKVLLPEKLIPPEKAPPEKKELDVGFKWKRFFRKIWGAVCITAIIGYLALFVWMMKRLYRYIKDGVTAPSLEPTPDSGERLPDTDIELLLLKNRTIFDLMRLSEDMPGAVDRLDERLWIFEDNIRESNLEIEELENEILELTEGVTEEEKEKVIKKIAPKIRKLEEEIRMQNFMSDMISLIKDPTEENLGRVMNLQDGESRYNLEIFRAACSNYLDRVSILKEAGFDSSNLARAHSLSYYKRLFIAPSMTLQELDRRAQNLLELGLAVKPATLSSRAETIAKKADLLKEKGKEATDATIRTPLYELMGEKEEEKEEEKEAEDKPFDPKMLDKRIRRVDLSSQRLLDTAARYLLKAEEEVDIVIDPTLVPNDPGQIEKNMETWAYLILLTRHLENVRFVFKMPYPEKGKDLGEELAQDIANSPKIGDLIDSLQKSIRNKAKTMGLKNKEVKKLIQQKVRTKKTPGAVEVPILQKSWLIWLDQNRNNSEKLGENQYPVAMDKCTTDENGEIALRNFRASLSVALAKASLVIAKRRDEGKKKNQKKELPKLRKEVLKKMQEVYDIVFDNARRKRVNRIILTEKTLNSMISPKPNVRIKLAIKLALPPVGRMAIDTLSELHKLIQLPLISA